VAGLFRRRPDLSSEFRERGGGTSIEMARFQQGGAAKADRPTVGGRTVGTTVGPEALPRRLYLVAYDRAGRRFGGNSQVLLEYGVRAAVLSELYLDGNLIDQSGRAKRSTTRPDDPILRTLFDRISDDRLPRWEQVILRVPGSFATLVRDDLHNAGWVSRDQRRRMGVIPTRGLEPADETVRTELVTEARYALGSLIASRSAPPRTLALGLLAYHAQLPATISFSDNAEDRAVMAASTAAAIAPIAALGAAIQTHFARVRADMGLNG